MRNKSNKCLHKYVNLYCSINSVDSYIRPPIVATFKDVLFEGHITYSVKTIYKYNMFSFK